MFSRQAVLRCIRLARRPGAVLLALAGLSLGFHLWLACGVFVPIARDPGVEYVFVSATIMTFAVAVLGSWAIVFPGHLLLRWSAARHAEQPPLFAREDVGYARPLFLFAASALGLLNLVPWAARVLPVWSYLIIDLRWWWTLLVLVWVLADIDRRLGGKVRTLAGRLRASLVGRRGMGEAAIVAIAVTWVVAGTPHLRFVKGAVGDEPKYLRYCELFYQGLGFDISQIQPIAELPAGFRPQLWRNFSMLGGVLPEELRTLAADTVTLLTDPLHRFNRARQDNGFVRGKNGGIYQLHNPGLSMLIFPAYYLDRRFARVTPGSAAQWPDDLPAVQVFLLALYALWTVIVFRFLRRCIGTDWPAWIAALVLVLTLPVAAFPFQYYPELAAGVLVSAVAGYLLFPGPGRAAPFFYGLLAGYLIWLHVRFTLVAAVLAVAALILLRRDSRRAATFLAGFAVPVAGFSLYTYQITGSILPTALWYSEGAPQLFSWSGMSRTSVAYLVDRDWGLFANSPAYLLALPGFWWMARRWPAAAWLSLAVLLALLLPSAGHTLHAAGTTPERLIVAALPFAATPMVESIRRLARTRWLQIGTAALVLLSLQNALAYNLHHYRDSGSLVDWSFSGWKVNLLFPGESRAPWRVSAADTALLGLWVAGLLALIVAPALIDRARKRGWTPPEWPHPSVPTAALAAVAMFGLLGTGVAATTGAWTRSAFQIPPEDAALEAARFLDTIGHCAICLSSSHGRVMTGTLMTELESVGPAVAERPTLTAVRSYDEWLAMPGRIRAWYLEANGIEPAGTDLGHYLYTWKEERASPNAIRRRIFEAAGKPVPSGPAKN